MTRSVPRRTIVAIVALAWAGVATTAVLFAQVGTMVDALAAGRAPRPGALTDTGMLAVLAGVLAWVGARIAQRASSAAERRLRRAVTARTFGLGVLGTDGRSGELLALSTGTVERVAHYRATFLGPILGAMTTPFVTLAVMAVTVDRDVAGWLALLVLLVPLAIGGFQRLTRPVGAAYRRTQGQLTAAFLEAIQALPTLVYARAAEHTGRRLAERGEAHRRSLMKLLAGNQLLILVVDAAFSLTVVVAATALAVGGIYGGGLTVGGAVAILLMTQLVVGPVDVVGQFFYVGIAGRAGQHQLSAHLSGDRVAPTGATAGDDPSDRGVIKLHAVTAGWPGAEPILRGIDLRVAPGERVALVGPSGIGKSTVAALVQGHLTPRAGTVLVDGIDVATHPEEARRHLAVVEQRNFLFLGTIADNLRLANPGADDDRLWDALDLANLRAEVEAMPNGLATPVGEHGALLSGGQAQRLAIARAFLRNAPVLLLDEPTSQVDLAGEAVILDALDRLAAGRTVLMVAHRPGAILTADRVIDLAELVRGRS